MDRTELSKLRAKIAQQLAEARAALPAHSMKPHQYQRVEELEEALAEIDARLDTERKKG